MAKVYHFMANGTEEIEALVVIDILRRAGIETVTVSTSGNDYIEGAHGVKITCDTTIEEADFADADLLLLPGGLPGSTNLLKHEGVRKAFTAQSANGKKVGAICAAPMVLGDLGILEGKRATCYPGCEDTLKGADYTEELYTIDGNVITGRGPAAAFPYAYAIVEWLGETQKAEMLKEGMIYNQLLKQA